MELRHLRYFLAVAETGSLSRAAEKLFIAQPPLSVQIRQLEEEMGTPLFVRHPKGVRLTAAGQTLCQEARELLDRAARLKEVLQHPGEGVSLTLGFVPSAASTVLPELVRRLHKQHPLVNLQLREMISTEQVEALVAGHLDASLARAPSRHPRVVMACTMADPFCLALPRDHEDGAAPVLDLRQFADHSFVGFTRHRGPAYFDQSIHLCHRAGFSPRIRYEASTVYGVLDLVGAGLGVALVPASAALLGVRGARLRPLRGKDSSEVLALLYRKADSHPLLPLLEESVGLIFASLREKLNRRLSETLPATGP